MKPTHRILLTIVAIAMMFTMACTSTTESAAVTAEQITEYRGGIERGNILMTGTITQAICESASMSKSDCDPVMRRALLANIEIVENLSDSEIEAYINSNSSYRGALAVGGKSSIDSVVPETCRVLVIDRVTCSNLIESLHKKNIEMWNSMPDKEIQRIKSVSID